MTTLVDFNDFTTNFTLTLVLIVATNIVIKANKSPALLMREHCCQQNICSLVFLPNNRNLTLITKSTVEAKYAGSSELYF